MNLEELPKSGVPAIDAAAAALARAVNHAVPVWISGGWAMIAIAAVGLAMFCLGAHVRIEMFRLGIGPARESRWRRWIERPEEIARGRRRGLGELLARASAFASTRDVNAAFDEFRAAEIAPFERDLRLMKMCVSAAPLLGLLGTVTGMVVTFSALSSGTGGDRTMSMISGGISEALITTETGLVVALPGLFLHFHLARRLAGYRDFVARLESVCSQRLQRRARPTRRERSAVRSA